MRPGQFSTSRGPLGTVLGVGDLAMHCYFRGNDGKQTVVFKHVDSPTGFECGSCGTFVIRGHFADDPES